MTRSSLCTRLAIAASLTLMGCSATHLTVGDEDAGVPRGTDASVPSATDGGRATVDARLLPAPDATISPGFDAWTPTPSDPDAWTPPTSEPDAWTPTPGADAGPTMDPDAGPPGVTCGTEVCVDPQVCCISFGGGPGGGGMSSMACGAPADCMGIAAACDGPEDCASGEACCGMRSAGGGGATGCVPDAMCGFGRLCHADGDCTGRDTCCSFMGRSVCSPFCP